MVEGGLERARRGFRMYSERLLDHFQNPRNVGTLDPPALVVEVSNPACGDLLQLSALAKEGRVREVRFKTRGCTASIAAGSALTELLQGRTLDELAVLTAADVEHAVGGLSNESKHAAVLAIDGLRALLRRLRDEDS
jgi:NifU-like protein involved in Fe-S cluster formation